MNVRLNRSWSLHSTLIAAVCLSSSCHRKDTSEPTPTPVRVERPSPRSKIDGLRYSASILPNAQVALNFKSGGYVERISERNDPMGRVRLIGAGDRVRKGEELASVRQEDYDQRVGQAEGQVAKAQAACEKSAGDFERASHLFAADSMTKTQFDALKAVQDENTAQLKIATAAWAEAKTARNDCVLRAPFDGWVADRSVEVGALVGPTSPALVVVDTHLVKADFAVPDSVIGKIRLGDRLTVTTTALTGTFPGIVTSIAPTADATSRVFPVEVTIENQDERLKAGMVAALNLSAGGPSSVTLLVPIGAVILSGKDQDGFAVFVCEERDGRAIAREQPVELGETVGNSIIVISGLKPTDRIVTVGATDLKDHSIVTILP